MIVMKTKTFRKSFLIGIAMITIASVPISKGLASSIKEVNVSFKSGDVTLSGFVAYDESIKGKRPVVLVVHEWWGLNDYIKMRARMLAGLGYFAMAVDMFGNGKVAANPKEAQEFTSPFYKDPSLGKMRLEGAISKLKEFPQADPNNVAAIGYCFGGFIVLNAAKLGADLKAVVSFHGGMVGVAVNKSLLKAKVLVCHGGSDKFVSKPEVDAFKHQLDSIGVVNTFKVYPGATHAFSNPDATRIGKEFNMPIEYNAAADKNSWNDMKIFLASVFKR
jgi:dienelactone hydrolase